MDPLTRDVLLAQDGDLAAVARVISSVQPDIRRFCIWFLGDSSEIDDVVQDTLVRIYKGLDSFRSDSRAMSWVLTIARRTCIDHGRQLARQQRLHLALENSSTQFFAPGVQSSIHLTELINSLPESLREPFVLVKMFGFSYAEVAEVLQCPIGTVQSRVARARTHLMTSLESAERIA